MALRLNGSSSGYVELDVPAAAGSHTLTLPDGGGSSGQYLQTNGSGALSWQTVSQPAAVAVLVDEKANSTNGGTFTSGSWVTRTLNTEQSDPQGIVTLLSDQFTLGAGTYRIDFHAPAFGVQRHQARLYDVTNTAVVAYGSSERAESATGGETSNRSFGTATVVITGNTVYRLEHRCDTSKTGLGLGYNVNFGTANIFAVVIIHKYKD